MKKPLNLKDLPNYLKKARDGGEQDLDLVVDMGTIKDDSLSINFKRFAFIGALCLSFLAVSSFVSYNLFSNKNIIIVLDTNSISPQEFSKIILEQGASVVSVKQNGDFSYEVELNTRKSISSFLEKLRKNKDVKKVELKNNN